jgi:hypothetical protein
LQGRVEHVEQLVGLQVAPIDRLLALDLQVTIARRVVRKREQIRPHAAIQDLREQPDAGVDLPRSERSQRLPATVAERHARLCRALASGAFAQSCRPVGLDRLVVDLREPLVVKRGQQVIGQQVAIVVVGAALKVGLVFFEPEGGELVEDRVAIARVKGRCRRAPDSGRDLTHHVLELELRSIVVPAVGLESERHPEPFALPPDSQCKAPLLVTLAPGLLDLSGPRASASRLRLACLRSAGLRHPQSEVAHVCDERRPRLQRRRPRALACAR